MEETFIVFDTETTGLYPHLGDVVIELAGAKANKKGDILEEFHRYINAGIPSHPETIGIHGITDQFIAKHGEPMEKVMNDWVAFVGDTTLVGHNIIGFDMKFINRHLLTVGLSPLENPLVDTLPLARNKMPQLSNHKLGTIATHFGIDYSKAHRALEDVKINVEVYVRLLLI